MIIAPGNAQSPRTIIESTREQPKLRGVLCVPFPNPQRSSGEDDELARQTRWAIEAAEQAGVELAPVVGSYDSYEQVLDRIRVKIREADLVVVMIREKNPNVFFEAGYALGLTKPILFLAHNDDPAPFDIVGIERFQFGSVIDDQARDELAGVMRKCLTVPPLRAAIASGLGDVRDALLALEPQTALFGKVIEQALTELRDWIASWSGSSLDIYGPQAVFDMGIFIMKNLQRAGFATAYYTGHPSWQFAEAGRQAATQYFAASQQAVGRGRTISRTYVIDDKEQLDEETFRERAWSDASANLEICYILDRDLPNPRARDFGLWDHELLAEIEYLSDPEGMPRLHRCRFSADAFHLREARGWQQAIEDKRRPCPDLPSERLLLEESALAVNTSYCHERTHGKEDCAAYHGGWQRLRLCNAVSTPRWHADFYTDAFARWSADALQKGSERRFDILITGLADYGMLYWVAQGIPHRLRTRCTFHVLDICRTPIESCRWLQQRLQRRMPPMKLDVKLIHCNVFDNPLDDESIDLITSDAFLTRFQTDDEKAGVVKEWLRVLRPDGRVVTTARLRERESDIQDEDRSAFIQRALAAGGKTIADLDRLATDYANHITSHPFPSDAELRSFLSANVRPPYEHEITTEWLPHMEMVSGTYGHIEIRGRPA